MNIPEFLRAQPVYQRTGQVLLLLKIIRYPDALLTYLNRHLPSAASHKIYFDFGTGTLDATYEPFKLQADKIMKRKGYASKNWITMKFPGENHSEKEWNKRLEIPVVFLLGMNQK